VQWKCGWPADNVPAGFSTAGNRMLSALINVTLFRHINTLQNKHQLSINIPQTIPEKRLICDGLEYSY
jgi:hypothetical protein